jgi:hypothetical protein|tara:strand:+ start:1075 stop:1503 length:429 start_codon:yes stop_codon:yes gene_type:complete
MIKTFRGLIADGSTEVIHLKTLTGRMGYKITKMQLMGEQPGTTNIESTVKVFSVAQTGAPTNNVDFADITLLAAGHHAKGNNTAEVVSNIVVFSNMIFNQDIFVTAVETQGSEPTNYHIELEQVKLDSNETAVVTLKNIKNR